MEVTPVWILRCRQQFVVTTGVTPGAQVVGVEIAVDLFQPRHFLCTAAVIAGDTPGQLPVFDFQLRTNQLNAELIRPRLKHQCRGGGTDSHKDRRHLGYGKRGYDNGIRQRYA